MTRLTKKQKQQLFLEEFLRRTREAPPGERVCLAVGDLFAAAEVRDLNEVRIAHGAAVDRGGDAQRNSPIDRARGD